jgi:Bifunctional DNA primase/polymerase, N-terminal
VSRPRWQLRDAALGHASRGIPVLPLHYPLPHRGDLQPVTGDMQPAVGSGCSCRDPGCGQVGKHPLGSLVPHGMKDATCNRARILAWWTRHPSANIGLPPATPSMSWTSTVPPARRPSRSWRPSMTWRALGRWSGPAGVAGTTTSPPPAWATLIPATSSMWTGGAGAAMWSPHPAATPSAIPTSGPPAATWTPHLRRYLRCCSSGSSPANASDQPVRSSSRPSLTARVTATHGWPWPRSWTGSPLPAGGTQPAAVGVDLQSLQPGRRRRPRPPRGRPRTAGRRRALRAAGRGAAPDPSHPGLGPPGRPRPSRPPTTAHPPRTHPSLAGDAPTSGRRPSPGEEVTPLAAAGQEAG